jgi:hypothetical protein
VRRLALVLTLLLAPSAHAATMAPVNTDGFGDANNTGVDRILAAGGYLFAGTHNTGGTKIYRSRDGAHWEEIGQAITPIAHTNDNEDTVSLGWFKNRLYVATWAPSGGASKGGDVFRADAGTPDARDIRWQTITRDSFGGRNRQALVGFAVLNDRLYAGTFNNNFPNESGSEIFRTATGDPHDWRVVAPKGFGDPQCNTDAHLNFAYDGYLYIGTEEAGCVYRKGANIWRTDGNLSPPYDQWQRVNASGGFGHPWNNNIFGMDVFKGYFYAATWSWGPGDEVWRAKLPPAGRPTTVPFDFQEASLPGFGSPENQWNTGMVHLGDALYVAGVGFDGEGRGYFLETDGVAGPGGLLTWDPITAPGWPPTPSGTGSGPYWLAVFNGKVYVAVYLGDRPSQLWAYTPDGSNLTRSNSLVIGSHG